MEIIPVNELKKIKPISKEHLEEQQYINNTITKAQKDGLRKVTLINLSDIALRDIRRSGYEVRRTTRERYCINSYTVEW